MKVGRVLTEKVDSAGRERKEEKMGRSVRRERGTVIRLEINK